MNTTFFSVEGVERRIKNSERYKNFTTQHKKDKWLDHCNFVTNAIIKANRQHSSYKNKGEFEPVPLHSEVLKQMLGNNHKGNATNYLTTLNYLQELNIIETDGEYRYLNRVDPKARQQQIDKGYTAHAKKFNLCEEWQEKKVVVVPILCEATEKKLLRFKEKQWRNNKRVRKYQNIHRALTQVWFDHYEGKRKLEQVEFEKKVDPQHSRDTYAADFRSLCELNELNRMEEFEMHRDYYLSPSLKCGRVFHFYNRIPSAFRECLRLRDGSQLSEVDLRNSQPLIIALQYYAHLQEIKSNDTYIEYAEQINKRIGIDIGNTICGITFSEIQKEAGQLLNSCILGKFYKDIAEHCVKEGSPELHRLLKEDYGEFKAQLLGYGLYNGNKHTGRQLPFKNAHDFERLLYIKYPSFMAYIRQMKSDKGYRSVSWKATTTESKIFIDGIFDTLEASRKDFVAVPVHDALIVRSEEAKQYRERLFQLLKTEFKPIFDIYGTHLKAENLFRIKAYV